MRWMIILLFGSLFAPAGMAAQLENWTISVSLNDDRTAEWVVNLTYKENVSRSDYFILGRITGLEMTAGDRFIECTTPVRDVGTLVLCENINASSVSYRFRALDQVSLIQGLSSFKHRLSITQLADYFSMTVKLPLGTGLVEQSKLADTGLSPFEPAWGKEASDGRRIFVQWEVREPRLGETLETSVIYERIASSESASLVLIPVMIAAFFIFIYVVRRRFFVKNILPMLTESERKVVEILLREKKDVDQREVVKETDFSKPKVTRILQDLEARGLVERIRRGRKNAIRLRKAK